MVSSFALIDHSANTFIGKLKRKKNIMFDIFSTSIDSLNITLNGKIQ
jgi:hypothetical protein